MVPYFLQRGDPLEAWQHTFHRSIHLCPSWCTDIPAAYFMSDIFSFPSGENLHHLRIVRNNFAKNQHENLRLLDRINLTVGGPVLANEYSVNSMSWFQLLAEHRNTIVGHNGSVDSVTSLPRRQSSVRAMNLSVCGNIRRASVLRLPSKLDVDSLTCECASQTCRVARTRSRVTPTTRTYLSTRQRKNKESIHQACINTLVPSSIQ